MRPTKIVSKKETCHGPAIDVKIIQNADGSLSIDEKSQRFARRLFQELADEQKRLDEIHPEAGGGVGLASNQIENKETPPNMYIVNIREIRAKSLGCEPVKPTVFINARFEVLPDAQIESKTEGCLSLQGLQHSEVPRHSKIKITAYVLDAETRRVELNEFVASDFIARVHQHEQDHCRGEEYLHRLEYDKEQLDSIQDWIVKNQGQEQKPGAVIIESLSCSGGIPDYAGLEAWVTEQLALCSARSLGLKRFG